MLQMSHIRCMCWIYAVYAACPDLYVYMLHVCRISRFAAYAAYAECGDSLAAACKLALGTDFNKNSHRSCISFFWQILVRTETDPYVRCLGFFFWNSYPGMLNGFSIDRLVCASLGSAVASDGGLNQQKPAPLAVTVALAMVTWRSRSFHIDKHTPGSRQPT